MTAGGGAPRDMAGLSGPGEVLVLLAPLAIAGHHLVPLPETELIGSATIRHTAARQAFLAGRRLLRGTLGPMLGLPPAAVPIRIEPGGRPCLGEGGGGLDFNLAHAGHHVGLALSRSAVVGFDIEDEAPPDHDAVARVIMSAGERASYLAAPPQGRPRAFLRAWCRKEALLKAAGTGFLTNPADIDVASHDAIGPDGAVYGLCDLPRGFPAGAVALRGARPRLHVRWLDAAGKTLP